MDLVIVARVALVVLAACTPVELLAVPVGEKCLEDSECGLAALCVGAVCHACPSLDACVEPEPLGKWKQLQRNGCTVCEFAPASECFGPSDCAEQCYRGDRCAAGCARFECCANVCEPAGCADTAPLGCQATCPIELACATACVTTLCRCFAGAWECDVGCAELSPTCTYDP